MPHQVISRAEKVLGCTLRVEGDIGLLERPRRALLISRGERSPTPADPQIRATIAATHKLIEAKETLVVGAHRVPWDLALWMTKCNRGSAIVALEEPERVGDFPDNALLVWPEKPAQSQTHDERLKFRDRLVGALASSAYAIQLRNGGNMALVAEEIKARQCSVEVWPTPIEVSRPIPVNSKPETRNPQPPFDFTTRLTHFTREPLWLWPGEKPADYFQWLSSGLTFQPRDAFQALRRILTEKFIYGCRKLIIGAEEMICLTQRDPFEIVAGKRWRKGLSRWTFSNYALSFLREDLEPIGARPVDYVSREVIQKESLESRSFMQIESSGGIDWREEQEWRVQGHLDFSQLNSERLIAIVSNSAEAQRIESEFGVRALVIPPTQL